VRWRGCPVAGGKKCSDDEAGDLAALIAYYGFVSIFPIMLVAFTVLDLALRNNPALRKHLISSALSTYPIIGTQMKSSVHPLSGTGLVLVIGLAGAVFRARAVSASVRGAFDTVCAVSRDGRHALPWSVLRGIGLSWSSRPDRSSRATCRRSPAGLAVVAGFAATGSFWRRLF
jgi:uncharacterized BrkB/YihY/UPF0761 family membrane protein